MVNIQINKEKCKSCNFCITVCPTKNIRISSKRNKKGFHYAQVIDIERCNGCGLCFKMCPDLCIEIEK